MTNIIEEKIKSSIKSYPDFPKKGILFRDVLTILKDPNLFNELIQEISNFDSIINSEAIIAIDARGFIFGSALSLYTKKPLLFARKPGKLPGNLITNTYELEYGTNELCLQKDVLKEFDSFSIIDDLLATGGTASSVEKMLIKENKKVTGLVVVVELLDLEGRKVLHCPVDSVVSF